MYTAEHEYNVTWWYVRGSNISTDRDRGVLIQGCLWNASKSHDS